MDSYVCDTLLEPSSFEHETAVLVLYINQRCEVTVLLLGL